MIEIIIVIVFLIVLVGIVSYYVLQKKKDTKIDPNTSHKCVGDACPKEIECGVLSTSTIKKCNPSDVNSICNSCKCSGLTNLTGCMVCTQVNKDRPYHVDIPREQCTDPFFWDNDICKLKDGYYCLPKVVNDITCPSTGRKLLVKTEIGYDWKCICKNDTQFTGTNCSDIKICGMLGANADTDNPTMYGRGLINKNNKNYWTSNSPWDPIVDGECKCGPNEFVDNTNFLCLPNGCYPGTSGTSKESCKCPPKYISCNSIATVFDPSSQLPAYFSGACKIPSCVPDPCGGADGNTGRYDVASGKCICNTADNYQLMTDPSNVLGQSCQKVCVDNGKCGDRGTCYYYNSTTAKLFTVVCSGNTTGSAVCTGSESLIYYKDSNNNTKYLNYNITGNNLNLSFESTGGEFIFEIVCDSSDPNNKCPPPGTKALFFQINATYYLRIGEKYVDLATGTLTIDKSKSLVRFLNTENPKQRNAANISTQIFIVKANSFFSADQNNTIVFAKNYENSERCKDCAVSKGWSQDPKDLCNRRCITPGSPCGYSEQVMTCCDGTTCQTQDRSDRGLLPINICK